MSNLRYNFQWHNFSIIYDLTVKMFLMNNTLYISRNYRRKCRFSIRTDCCVR